MLLLEINTKLLQGLLAVINVTLRINDFLSTSLLVFLTLASLCLSVSVCFLSVCVPYPPVSLCMLTCITGLFSLPLFLAVRASICLSVCPICSSYWESLLFHDKNVRMICYGSFAFSFVEVHGGGVWGFAFMYCSHKWSVFSGSFEKSVNHDGQLQGHVADTIPYL